MTLSITMLCFVLSVVMLECHILFNIMLSDIMLNVVRLSVVAPITRTLSAVTLNVAAPRN
jgi:hypothetical protein